MRNLLKIVTKCIDKFSKESGTKRLAAIIGGEAVIMHGIPRTTLDLDLTLHLEGDLVQSPDFFRQLEKFFKKELGDRFEVKAIQASRDPFDPIRHDLIIVTDREKRFKKLDILIANFMWELEGFKEMVSPDVGDIAPYPIPYLVGLKLLAGGIQDEQDIRNLFLVMSESEKKKTQGLAQTIRRNKNLDRILGLDASQSKT
jgi:hypothetical protein